jgi:enoyl-CoA hydratase/carnithine racemase
MAIASDFILMAESAQIGLPEVSIGTFLGGGVTYLLPRLVGLAKARELVFLGERIKGEEAVRIGLANRVLPDEGFLDAAREFAGADCRQGALVDATGQGAAEHGCGTYARRRTDRRARRNDLRR